MKKSVSAMLLAAFVLACTAFTVAAPTPAPDAAGGAAYKEDGNPTAASKLFDLAKKDLKMVSVYQLPSVPAKIYSTVASDLNTFTGSTIALPLIPSAPSAPVVEAQSNDQSAPSDQPAPIEVNGFTTTIDAINNYMVDYCVDFTNTSNIAATVVRFEFYSTDGFGQVTGVNFTEDASGMFSPNVEIHHRGYRNGVTGQPQLAQNCWANAPVLTPPAGGQEMVRVTKVLFSDGSVWVPSSQ